MRMKVAIVTTCLALLGAVPVAVAHHAFAAEFDVNKPVTLKGTMDKWDMVNPHSWFHINVKDPATGKLTEWMVEGGSPNTLIRLARGGRSDAADRPSNGVSRRLVDGTTVTVPPNVCKPAGVARSGL
jgi:hypothetical protein